MDEILTRAEVAQRWKCSVSALDGMIKANVIKPCKKLPGVKFKFSDVLAAEGTKFNPLSPMEKRRLEREKEALEVENRTLRMTLTDITVRANQFVLSEMERRA